VRQVRGLTQDQVALLKADLAAEEKDAAVRRATHWWQLLKMVAKGRYFPLLVVLHLIPGACLRGALPRAGPRSHAGGKRPRPAGSRLR
jgi:hypothetical protein